MGETPFGFFKQRAQNTHAPKGGGKVLFVFWEGEKVIEGKKGLKSKVSWGSVCENLRFW